MGSSSTSTLCFCLEILISTFISDLWGTMMGFDNLPKPALVLIVHTFGEPLSSGMCIVLVPEKVSVVLVAHKKSTRNMNE